MRNHEAIMSNMSLPRAVRIGLCALAIELGAAALLCAAPAASAPQLDNLGDSLLDADLAKAFAPESKDPAAKKPAEGAEWLPDADLLKRIMESETTQRQQQPSPAGEDAARSVTDLYQENPRKDLPTGI